MNQDRAQKTQKPTPKRREEFRKQGKIAISKDLSFVVMMVFGGALGLAYSHDVNNSVFSLMRLGLKAGLDRPIYELYQAGAIALIRSTWPVMFGATVGVIVATGFQLGWPPALKKIEFKPGKVLSMGAMKQLLSLKEAGGRVLKATAKAGFVLVVLALVINSEYEKFLNKPALEALGIAQTVLSAIVRLGLYSMLVLGMLAVVDFSFQKKKMMSEMMMSMEDVKEEHKKQEGDPQIKGKRKQKMRELASRRIKAEVAQADVVLVNPTHYSVALRYNKTSSGAPKLVAKGKDELAAKIREFARNAGVPIVSRPPLTRLIYRIVPEGQEIPPDLYQAVAEILAYIYRLRKRNGLG